MPIGPWCFQDSQLQKNHISLTRAIDPMDVESSRCKVPHILTTWEVNGMGLIRAATNRLLRGKEVPSDLLSAPHRRSPIRLIVNSAKAARAGSSPRVIPSSMVGMLWHGDKDPAPGGRNDKLHAWVPSPKLLIGISSLVVQCWPSRGKGNDTDWKARSVALVACHQSIFVIPSISRFRYSGLTYPT